LEKTELGAEAASEVVMNILLAIFTAGVGVAANLAIKSGRLVKVANLLQKIAAGLKRVNTFQKLPKKRKGGGFLGFSDKKKTRAKKDGVPPPEQPKKKVGDDGPKTTDGNDAALSKAPKEMFTEGADGKAGQNIKPKHLHRELRKSEIGRETLDIIEQRNIDVVLSHQKPLFESPGYKTYGVSYDDTAVAYLSNTQSKVKTAQTVIHEVTHCAGVKGTQRAEIIAEMRALKHIKEKPSYSDVKGIIKRITKDYPELPYK
jgi:hypothetical protein